MTPDDARALVEQVRISADDIRDRLLALYVGRGWLALGYGSWADMCETEFDSVAVGRLLPREQRRELVNDLTAGGMSTRAIGGALGIDPMTASRDRAAGVANDTPARVIGLDGKTYTPPTPEERAHRAAWDKKARDQAEREAGIRDANRSVAEAVHLLGKLDARTWMRAFYPHHDTYVGEGVRVTRDRLTAARQFIDQLLERPDL